MQNQILPLSVIGDRIYFIRGHRVMLDSDLALLYQVETKVLKQAVRRNIERFPTDFMFQLSVDDLQSLRSQFVTLDVAGRGKYSKYLPFVFTEQGVSMLSSVINNKTAIQVNIEIMRAFVKLSSILETHKDLAKQINQLELKYDQQFRVVFDAIRKLMETGSPIVQKPIKGLNNSKINQKS